MEPRERAWKGVFLEDEKLLLFLALKTGLLGKAKTSTSKISDVFGVSQQTASRKLRELKKQGLIGLNASPSGCEISITNKGISLLREDFLSLKNLFEGRSEARVFGTVKSGLGEGRYYISRHGYVKQFKKLLGFKPFFGTLNLTIPQQNIESFVSGLAPVSIKGFETPERSFGKITAFRIEVQGKQEAVLIIPERTTHSKNEVEVIAKINLRKKFKLKEGSKVSLSMAKLSSPL